MQKQRAGYPSFVKTMTDKNSKRLNEIKTGTSTCSSPFTSLYTQQTKSQNVFVSFVLCFQNFIFTFFKKNTQVTRIQKKKIEQDRYLMFSMKHSHIVCIKNSLIFE